MIVKDYNICYNNLWKTLRTHRQEIIMNKIKISKLLGVILTMAILTTPMAACSDFNYESDNPIIVIDVKQHGKIYVELDPDSAPISVQNFLDLVELKYYDGLNFHRIIKGFMIQGGQGNSSSPAVSSIKGEFSENGVNNTINHTRGTISMARTKVMDSATSQFFICDADSPHLNGKYAGFGKVVQGLEVVDSIAKTSVIDRNGTVEEGKEPIIKSIRVYTK